MRQEVYVTGAVHRFWVTAVIPYMLLDTPLRVKAEDEEDGETTGANAALAQKVEVS